MAKMSERPPEGLRGRGIAIFSPVGLDEDAVDVFEVDDAGLVTDGFDE